MLNERKNNVENAVINHSLTPNLCIAHVITFLKPCQKLFQIHKVKTELRSFSSKIFLHLSYNKNGISGSLTLRKSKLIIISREWQKVM